MLFSGIKVLFAIKEGDFERGIRIEILVLVYRSHLDFIIVNKWKPHVSV